MFYWRRLSDPLFGYAPSVRIVLVTMIRTWIYVFCWAILIVMVPAWIEAPYSFQLVPAAGFLLLFLPWVLDGVLARRAFRKSRWTVVVRILNFLPVLLLIANVLIDRAMNRFSRPDIRKMSFSAVNGSEYLRVRFPRERRAAIEAALASRCRVKPESEMRWSLLSTSKPTAKSMPWDPPAAPLLPRLCGPDPGYQTDFGSSGDSLLLYYEGH